MVSQKEAAHPFPWPTADAWKQSATLPLPAWASPGRTLFDLPSRSLGAEGPPAQVGVCSVAFDGTATSRAGAREGPGAVRDASRVYAAQAALRAPEPLRNLRTDEVLIPTALDGCDYGDLHVLPSDPRGQVEVTAAEAMRVALDHPLVVALGGDHSVSFPLFCGVAAADGMLAGGARLGYVQIDHHFDFGDHSALHGPYYHGSNARRISEHPLAAPGALGFVGQGDLTRDAQLTDLRRRCAAIRTIADVRRTGMAAAARSVFAAVLERCDALYVSLDVDVCDASALSGTGNVTIGGVSAAELLELVAVLREFPVRCLDIVEISPRYDSSGATAAIVARLLYEWLMLAPA